MIPISELKTYFTEGNVVVLGIPLARGLIPIIVWGDIESFNRFVLLQNELLEVYRLQKHTIPDVFLRAFEGGGSGKSGK